MMTIRSSMTVHSINPASFVVWLLAVLKVFGGAFLLWMLGAPSWALGAWLLLHVCFSVGRSRPRPACELSCEQDADQSWQMLSSQAAENAILTPKNPARERGSRK